MAVKLKNIISGEIYPATITGWLNTSPAKCQPTINIPSLGDIEDADFGRWEVAEASPTETEMIKGCGFYRRQT